MSLFVLFPTINLVVEIIGLAFSRILFANLMLASKEQLSQLGLQQILPY